MRGAAPRGPCEPHQREHALIEHCFVKRRERRCRALHEILVWVNEVGRVDLWCGRSASSGLKPSKNRPGSLVVPQRFSSASSCFEMYARDPPKSE